MEIHGYKVPSTYTTNFLQVLSVQMSQTEGRNDEQIQTSFRSGGSCAVEEAFDRRDLPLISRGVLSLSTAIGATNRDEEAAPLEATTTPDPMPPFFLQKLVA
jgi:hypothetical protein